MPDKPPPEEIALWQRRLASQANNRAWTLSELASRTPEEDEEMLQAAHAAMYFWRIAGNDNHRANAALLVAHVYALLGVPNHAEAFLAKAEPTFFSAEPSEVAFAHAVAANVAAAKKDTATHRAHYDKAFELMAQLPNPQDRKILEATLRILPKPHDR
jgi:hypothetical protein